VWGSGTWKHSPFTVAGPSGIPTRFPFHPWPPKGTRTLEQLCGFHCLIVARNLPPVYLKETCFTVRGPPVLRHRENVAPPAWALRPGEPASSQRGPAAEVQPSSRNLLVEKSTNSVFLVKMYRSFRQEKDGQKRKDKFGLKLYGNAKLKTASRRISPGSLALSPRIAGFLQSGANKRITTMSLHFQP